MNGRHIFLALQSGNPLYYASCHILNDRSLLYVYLLHPSQGSILFTMLFDNDTALYQPRYIVPGLDKATVRLINKKIHGGYEKLHDIYNGDYRFVQTGTSYGYVVINRLYKKDKDTVNPTAKYHVFYESWDAISEYEWDMANEPRTLSGNPMPQNVQGMVQKAISLM